MFKITPIQSIEEQKKHAEECGIPYREGYFAYAMADADTLALMGMAQFEIEGEVAYISDLASAKSIDDFEAMFILGRQTMNFIDLCGVCNIKASKETAYEKLLLAIGFRLQCDGSYYCNTEGMFDGKHCSGHAVNLKQYDSKK